MKSLETNRSINTALVYAALGAGALLMIFPFIWMVFTSFKSAGESVQIPPTILPKQWMKENYLRAIASLPFMKLYVNTALLILFRVLCAVAFSSAAGFAFAKLKFRGKNLLFSLVIVQMMLPSDIHYSPVPDVSQNGTDKQHVCAGISGVSQRVRHLFPQAGLHGHSG